MAYIGQVGTLQVAGLTLSLTNLKILHTTLTTNSYSNFYDASIGASRAVYQVSSGKTFQLYAAVIDQISASGTSIGIEILYADTAIGINQSSAPTNPVGMISGVASQNLADGINSNNLLGSTVKAFAIGGSAPSGKYLYINNNATVTLYGYEV